MEAFRKNFFRFLRYFAAVGCFLNFASLSAQAYDKAQKLKSENFKVCGVGLKLEVARNNEERSTGLMFRTKVSSGTGMLFVFPTEQPLSFWMKNVPFDIDIAYFDSKGRFLNAITMKGASPLMNEAFLPRYESRGSAQFAVETESGFFKKVKTKGCRLEPLPAISAGF